MAYNSELLVAALAQAESIEVETRKQALVKCNEVLDCMDKERGHD